MKLTHIKWVPNRTNHDFQYMSIIAKVTTNQCVAHFSQINNNSSLNVNHVFLSVLTVQSVQSVLSVLSVLRYFSPEFNGRIWKEVGGCLISYNLQLACVRKLEFI